MWYLRPLVIALVFLSLSGLAACSMEEKDDDPPENTPDPLIEIQQHVQTFLQEAEQRGRTQALYNPSALQIIVQEQVAQEGNDLCGYGGANPTTEQPEIYIATNENCWDDRTTWDREIIVFHELGHALIGRSHRDDTLPNGLRSSIMFGGNIFGLYTDALLERRTYYVDELFNPNTPSPTWGY